VEETEVEMVEETEVEMVEETEVEMAEEAFLIFRTYQSIVYCHVDYDIPFLRVYFHDG
jgi:hypothetical protein